ncbi:hypothetical protein EDC96DRAFT_531872 [Choanephora cucurbitarum]|nr:hypothetical protein EDC96DRAFT_531872 [Choanephora cucurbitarum]
MSKHLKTREKELRVYTSKIGLCFHFSLFETSTCFSFVCLLVRDALFFLSVKRKLLILYNEMTLLSLLFLCRYIV